MGKRSPVQSKGPLTPEDAQEIGPKRLIDLLHELKNSNPCQQEAARAVAALRPLLEFLGVVPKQEWLTSLSGMRTLQASKEAGWKAGCDASFDVTLTSEAGTALVDVEGEHVLHPVDRSAFFVAKGAALDTGVAEVARLIFGVDGAVWQLHEGFAVNNFYWHAVKVFQGWEWTQGSGLLA